MNKNVKNENKKISAISTGPQYTRLFFLLYQELPVVNFTAVQLSN